MANQATVMDPLFKDRPELDWPRRGLGGADGGVDARAGDQPRESRTFSKGAEFDALAMKLNQQAAELGNTYAGKEAGRRAALGNMKATCKECRKKFR